jgi:hypothetical protein
MAWGRALFIATMPLAAIALASNDPKTFWRDDLPYTVLLIAPYALLVFFLSRPAAQRALARTNDSWIARGGLPMLVIVVAFGVLYGWLASTGAAGGGPRLFGFDHLRGGAGATESAAFRFMRGLEQANAFVAKKAVAIVLLGHAITGLVAVSIPSRNKMVENTRVGTTLLWLVACIASMLCGSLAQMTGWRLLKGTTDLPIQVLLTCVGGATFGFMQAAVPLQSAQPSAVRWIVASAIGWTAGVMASGALFGALEADYWQFSARTFLAVAPLGLSLGAAQAIVLRGESATRWLWLAAVAVALPVGLAIYLPFAPDLSFDNLAERDVEEVLSAARHRGLILVAVQGASLALFTAPLLWRTASQSTTQRKEHTVTGKQDVFKLMGFMTIYWPLQLVMPLFLMGMVTWLVNQPNFDLTKEGPLILVALGVWALWDLTRLIKWMGFQVVVSDQEITVGKQTVAWTDISAAKVRPAVKFQTWIELTPTSGEPLKIPAAVGQKDLLLTLVQKHYPDLKQG